jgi:hypothetical protein
MDKIRTLTVENKLLKERIVELEKERAELKEENTSLQAYAFRVIAFVTKSVEKLRGIPEFKPTGDVLNRVLRLTPKIALEAHNLEQQSKGVEDAIHNSPSRLEYSLPLVSTLELYNYSSDLREQAEALKEQGEW